VTERDYTDAPIPTHDGYIPTTYLRIVERKAFDNKSIEHVLQQWWINTDDPKLNVGFWQDVPTLSELGDKDA